MFWHKMSDVTIMNILEMFVVQHLGLQHLIHFTVWQFKTNQSRFCESYTSSNWVLRIKSSQCAKYERFWEYFANICPLKKTADPSNFCQQTFYIVNFCITFVKAKGNIRISRLKYSFLKVGLNFFHKNCACFDDFLEIAELHICYCKIVDREIDFGKWKNW